MLQQNKRVAFIHSGDYFGEMALVGEAQPRTATIKASVNNNKRFFF